MNLTQIRIVRLKLLGHEEEKDPVKELQAIQGGYSHEEEYTLTKKYIMKRTTKATNRKNYFL